MTDMPKTSKPFMDQGARKASKTAAVGQLSGAQKDQDAKGGVRIVPGNTIRMRP